jgi:IrrE N-terminal-like domain
MNLIQEFLNFEGTTSLLEACKSAVSNCVGELVSNRGAIDLTAVAARNQITVVESDALSAEGVFERDGFGNCSIVLRRSSSQRRKRFTLAHELGHWILQQQLRELLGSTAGRLFRGLSANRAQVRDEEKLANLLAAELLMPSHAMKAAVDIERDRLMKVLRQLCQTYKVSRITALRRLADVFDVRVFFVELIPMRWNDLNSLTEVDDAVFATSGESTLYARESTYLSLPVPFCSMFDSPRMDLVFDTPKGRIQSDFEIDFSTLPVAHAFAMAVLNGSWHQPQRNECHS